MSKRPSFSLISAKVFSTNGCQVWVVRRTVWISSAALSSWLRARSTSTLRDEGAERIGLKLLEFVDKILCLDQVFLVARLTISQQAGREFGQVQRPVVEGFQVTECSWFSNSAHDNFRGLWANRH